MAKTLRYYLSCELYKFELKYGAESRPSPLLVGKRQDEVESLPPLLDLSYCRVNPSGIVFTYNRKHTIAITDQASCVTDKIKSNLEKITDELNNAGYDSLFARPYKGEVGKEIQEKGIMSEWINSMRHKYGIIISNEVHINETNNKKCMPDFTAELAGKRISVEVTLFVKEELVKRISSRKRSGQEYPYYLEYCQSQFNFRSFERRMRKRIEEKQNKAISQNLVIDALVIAGAAPWLMEKDVREWLNKAQFAPTNNIRSAYIVMTYDPNTPDFYPVLNVFGSVA